MTTREAGDTFGWKWTYPMKILIVARSLPRPTWGAGTRNYHLLRALASEHDVSLLALVDEHEREQSAAAHLIPHTRAVRQVECAACWLQAN